MQVFIIEPHLTMTDVFHADEFNREVIKQLREYGVEFYEVTNKNITRRRSQLSGDAIVILYNEHCVSDDATDEVQVLLKKAIEKMLRYGLLQSINQQGCQGSNIR